jgi:hypothetical protein
MVHCNANRANDQSTPLLRWQLLVYTESTRGPKLDNVRHRMGFCALCGVHLRDWSVSVRNFRCLPELATHHSSWRLLGVVSDSTASSPVHNRLLLVIYSDLCADCRLAVYIALGVQKGWRDRPDFEAVASPKDSRVASISWVSIG